MGGGSNVPQGWQISEREIDKFGAAIGDIEKDHGGIDKGVVGVELGVEGAGVVPKGGVFDGDGAGGVNVPGEFVDLDDVDALAVRVGFDLLDVTAKIANFVEGVPGSHLEFDFVLDIGNFHGDVEEVLVWVGEGDVVMDRGGGCAGEE